MGRKRVRIRADGEVVSPICTYCCLINMTVFANLKAEPRDVEANPAHPSVLFSQAN